MHPKWAPEKPADVSTVNIHLEQQLRMFQPLLNHLNLNLNLIKLQHLSENATFGCMLESGVLPQCVCVCASCYAPATRPQRIPPL